MYIIWNQQGMKNNQQPRRRKMTRFEKWFENNDELTEFVEFMKTENDLEFHYDRVQKRVWIETDEETAAHLSEMDAM
jgi:hypothetical protein